jgi:hypothetical protein
LTGTEREGQHLLKPNGHALRKQAQVEVCNHPKSELYKDPENGEEVCEKCGVVLRVNHPKSDNVTKFGRGPQNFAVFHGNLGSTTKQGPDKKGAEPIHQLVVGTVRGSLKYNRRPLKIITKSCPHCRTENHLHLFGDPIFCENPTCGAYVVICEHCEAENIGRELSKLKKCSVCRKSLHPSDKDFVRTRLAEQVIRWIPVDPFQYGRNCSAVGYMNDLRMLESQWDLPDDDFAYKKARELFSKRFDGQLTDEDASYLAAKYLKAVRQLVREQRHGLPKMLESLLDTVLTFQDGIASEEPN